jgi:hypothetical protein
MTNEQHFPKSDAGITDIIGSMMGLASAGTKFTIRQMQNAIGVFTDSQAVMNNVRDSLDNISSAMTKPDAEAVVAAAPRPAHTVFTGRKL